MLDALGSQLIGAGQSTLLAKELSVTGGSRPSLPHLPSKQPIIPGLDQVNH